MKKSTVAILMCSCVLAVLCLAGCACASTEVSRSSDKDFAIESEQTKEPVSTDPVYIMAIGNDSRYQTSEDKGFSPDDPTFGDTIMVLRVDPATNYVSVLSIPRDTAATVDGQPDKVNFFHFVGGPEMLSAEVGEMLGVEIPYYFDMKFVDFADFVDRIGGVTVDVPMSISGTDIISGESLSLDSGTSTLDGASSLLFARLRKVYTTQGEAIRQLNARSLVSSAVQFVADQPSSEAGTYAGLLESIGETNMSEEELEAYLAAFMNNDEPINFNLGTAPYDGDIDETGAWRVTYDPDFYAQLREAMETGAPLTDLVANPEVY